MNIFRSNLIFIVFILWASSALSTVGWGEEANEMVDYSVNLDPLSAIGSLIQAKDYIDIISKMELQDDETGEIREITSVILRRVLVKKVERLDSNGIELKTIEVVLLLHPDYVTLVDFAKKKGEIQFVIRGPELPDTFEVPDSFRGEIKVDQNEKVL